MWYMANYFDKIGCNVQGEIGFQNLKKFWLEKVLNELIHFL